MGAMFGMGEAMTRRAAGRKHDYHDPHGHYRAMAAMLIQMAISAAGNLPPTRRGRGSSMRTTLANALLKLEGYNKQLPMQVNPATAQMYIVNPLTAGGITKAIQHPSPDSGTRGPG